MGKKVLFVIDFMKDAMPKDVFPEALLPLDSARPALAAAEKAVASARAKGIPVIYLNDAHHPEDAELKKVGVHCLEGTRGAEVVDNLKPRAGDLVFTKRESNGFTNPELEKKLRELGVEEIYEVGDVCVLYNARAAGEKGFKVKVVRDATFGQDMNVGGAYPFKDLLEKVAGVGAEVISSTQLD